MKKKVVSVILAMTMVASMAMGCGSSSDTTTSDNSTTTTTTNDAAASTEASDAADATADAANGDLADKKVGVCIYQFADNFMTLFRGELENYLVEQGFSKDNITIVDGANDQATQTNQIQNFITQGVDVLIINPVNSSSAETITDMVVEAGIPLAAIQAGRELRVIVGADKMTDDEAEKLSGEIATKIQNEMTYPGQVKITVIREVRSVAYAK